MLIVHHLGVSQSERIVWLCEELGVEYKLIKYTRDPLLSPESLKSRPGNDLGQAPFFEDDSNGVKLSESAAIAEYVASRYGNGKLIVKPTDPNYGDYLQWWHYSNGTLQPAMVDYQFLDIVASDDNDIHKLVWNRLQIRLEYLDKHLGNVKYLAGSELSLADIMTVYTLSTQRYWVVSDPVNSFCTSPFVARANHVHLSPRVHEQILVLTKILFATSRILGKCHPTKGRWRRETQK